MGYFDESETFKQSCLGGIKKEPFVLSFKMFLNVFFDLKVSDYFQFDIILRQNYNSPTVAPQTYNFLSPKPISQIGLVHQCQQSLCEKVTVCTNVFIWDHDLFQGAISNVISLLTRTELPRISFLLPVHSQPDISCSDNDFLCTFKFNKKNFTLRCRHQVESFDGHQSEGL